MTSRQSNIIFYSVISLIIYALIINYTFPEFFENFTKSKTELSIKEAIDEGENEVALRLYQQIVDEKVEEDSLNTPETAVLYEEMAQLHSLLGDKAEEKNYYLKSLNIKEDLKITDSYAFSNTYFKLGELEQEQKQYDQAQMYFEKSLSKRLGSDEKKDKGFFVGMQNTRQQYLRLNNEITIGIFNKLANIHRLKKEDAIAKTYYEKALAVSVEIFGEEDSKTIELRNYINALRI